VGETLHDPLLKSKGVIVGGRGVVPGGERPERWEGREGVGERRGGNMIYMVCRRF
jgi:hypothetical protein